MNIQPIFSSFIVEESLNLDNVVLQDLCYSKLSTSGIDSMVDISRNDHPSFKELIDLVEHKLNQVHSAVGLVPHIKQHVQQAWVNLNRRTHINSPHQHPRYMLSACYYVKADDHSDMLEFITPVTAHQYTIPSPFISEFNQYTSASWAVAPVTGKLVIFPSWLMHYVKLNDSTNDRISIAFNSNIAF